MEQQSIARCRQKHETVQNKRIQLEQSPEDHMEITWDLMFHSIWGPTHMLALHSSGHKVQAEEARV